MDQNKETIAKIKDDLKAGKRTAKEVVGSFLERIENYDKGEMGINAVLTVNKEGAIAAAAKVDEKIKKGEPLKELEGVPIAIKDVLCTKGIRTTAASQILDNYVPTYDATAVKRLKKAGAIIIAKTNCDEFAHGGSGENSSYGATRNPFDLSRVPGGSSAGSGAIVAYEGAAAALGTDTGGSVRCPASFLGLAGIKPTYGRVPRYGLMSMCSSTDTVAPIAHTVEDLATLMSVMSGKDGKDATATGLYGKDFTRDFSKGLRGLKVAYPKEIEQEGLEEGVKEVFFRNLEQLKKEGAEVEEISLEFFGDPAVAVYYILVPSEISSNIAKFDGVKYGMRDGEAETLKDMYFNTRTKYLGPEVKRRIMLGNFALSAGYYDAYYNKAQKVRQLMKQEMAKVFEKFDLVVTPTMASVAFKIGEKEDPLAMYVTDFYLVFASLTGICSVSVNGGWVKNPDQGKSIMGNVGKLPVGLQMMGKWWDEETVLRAAFAFEKLQKD